MWPVATIVLLWGNWTTKLSRIYCSIDSSKRQLWLTSEESTDVKTKKQQRVKMDKRVKAKTWLEIILIISGVCCSMTDLLWNTVQCIPEELLRSLIDGLCFVETISMRFFIYVLNNCSTSEYLVKNSTNMILQNLHQSKNLNKPIIAPCNFLFLSDFQLFQSKQAFTTHCNWLVWFLTYNSLPKMF